MARDEVLEWLRSQRQKGNHEFFAQHEIQKGMKRDGISLSAPSISRSFVALLCHYKDDIDFRLQGEWYSKRYVIRAKVSRRLQVSDMKRVHNTYRKMDQSRGRGVPGVASASGKEAAEAKTPW